MRWEGIVWRREMGVAVRKEKPMIRVEHRRVRIVACIVCIASSRDGLVVKLVLKNQCVVLLVSKSLDLR